MDNFSWQNSAELDEKIQNLEDLLYVLQGLTGQDFIQTTAAEELKSFKERLLSAGISLAEFNKIIAWVESAPQELSVFLKSALVTLWVESLLPDFHGSTALACQCGQSLFMNTANTLPLTKTFLYFIHQKRNTYWLALRESFSHQDDLTPWLQFYLDCVSDFLQENIEDLSHLGFRMEFENINKLHLNLRQKKFICFVMDIPSTVISNESYCAFNLCSRESAKRDLADLVRKKVIQPIGKGRGAKYTLLSSD